MEKKRRRDPEKANIVEKTAEIHGVSKRLVYQVISGDRINEEVLTTYMNLLEAYKEATEHVKLKAHINKIVPIN